jgi:hypothetical protein
MGPQGGGGATQAFSIPAQPQAPPRGNAPPPPASIPQGPSEYTRMISLSGSGVPSAPPAPPPPTQGGGMAQMQMPQMQMPMAPQMPQMPQVPQAPMMPQFQAPQAPQFQAPQMQMQAKAPSSNLLLFAIIGVLIFIAGIVVTMLVLKK